MKSVERPRSEGGGLMSQVITRQDLVRRCFVSARPMPEEAPVMRATGLVIVDWSGFGKRGEQGEAEASDGLRVGFLYLLNTRCLCYICLLRWSSARHLRCMLCEWQVWDAERTRFPPLFTVEKELG